MYHLISGGSSGLGFEIAKRLVLNKESVILTGRNLLKLEKAKGELQSLAPQSEILVHALNISNEAEVNQLLTTLNLNNRVVKTLFNVAGTTYFGKLSDITRSEIDQVLESNFIGLVLMTSRVSEYMLEKKALKPRIISILSTAALKGKKNETIYNAAKWGARGFLESVRDELEQTPIELINVFPGGMKTPFWDQSHSGYAVDKFMDPAEVASQIVGAALAEKVLVTDITIGRPKL